MKEPPIDVGATFVLEIGYGFKEFVILLSWQGETCRVQDVHGVIHIVPTLSLKYPAIKS